MSTEIKDEGVNPEAEKGQFIGPRKVAMAVSTDHKTSGGNEVVEIHYEGGFKEMMPKNAFELMVTDKPSDWNALRDRKFKVILKELLTVVAEHDFKASDIEALNNAFANELFNGFNRATHYLWTKDDKSFIPGNNVVLERSLLEADMIIKSIEDEPTDKPKSEETSGEDA